MAYVPPHKRLTKGSPSVEPTSPPSFLTPNIRKSLNLKSFGKEKNFQCKNIAYRKHTVWKWFTVGLADDSLFSSVLSLQPVLVEFIQPNSGQKPLSLVLIEGCSEGIITNELIDTPWILVAANIKQELLFSIQEMKCEMEKSDMAVVKPSVVARFGKILFYGNYSMGEESLETNPFSETAVRKMKRNLYSNVPAAYMDYIEHRVVEKLGLEYVHGKELYKVKLSDRLRPDSIVSCKCTVVKDHNKIQLNKIELNRVRHMVADMSCLGKSSDLRLMLCTKKIELILSDEEINGINELIGSAVLDSEVEGGLRWPFSRESTCGRYAAIGIGHTTAKSYGNSSIRFKLRHADRFDFSSSISEVTREIFLKMPGIISELHKQTIDEDLVVEMLENNLKLIWDHRLLDGSLN